MLDCGYSTAEIEAEIADYLAVPELNWLYRHPSLPGLVLCAGLFLWGGFTSMAVAGLLGPVLLLHQSSPSTFSAIAAAGAVSPPGTSPPITPWWPCWTYGEGWHNNHHRFPRSARAGFRWWELDLFYGVICLFEWLGLVWDVERVGRNRISQAAPA